MFHTCEASQGQPTRESAHCKSALTAHDQQSLRRPSRPPRDDVSLRFPCPCSVPTVDLKLDLRKCAYMLLPPWLIPRYQHPIWIFPVKHVSGHVLIWPSNMPLNPFTGSVVIGGPTHAPAASSTCLLDPNLMQNLDQLNPLYRLFCID